MVESLNHDGFQPDILVNNAGIGWYGYFHHMPWEVARDLLALNIEATTHLTMLVLTPYVVNWIMGISSTLVLWQANSLNKALRYTHPQNHFWIHLLLHFFGNFPEQKSMFLWLGLDPLKLNSLMLHESWRTAVTFQPKD